MAPRKTATPTAFDFSTVETVEAELPKSGKEQPNPLLEAAEWSLENRQARAMVIPPEALKEAQNLVRRAAKTLEVGHRMRTRQRSDGQLDFVFQLRYEKKKRLYTAAQVRAWAISVGYDAEDLTGRLPSNVTQAYRRAHNLPVAADE